ncbi:LAFA_0B06832g1_1 [Lachancea sp. 'fantastica']|nr:LAFA_0B06832g1_1 [Lachancea sp. 'fantastica']
MSQDANSTLSNGKSSLLKDADERLLSAGTAVPEWDEFEMDDFNMEEAERGDVTAGHEAGSRKEQWLYLKKSNAFMRALRRFWYGPEVPEDLPPSFPGKWKLTERIDKFPTSGLRKRYSWSIRTMILVLYVCIWGALMCGFIQYYYIKPPAFHRDDGTQIPVRTMDCQSTLFWKGKNNDCGIDASECLPFEDEEVYIRCPALCDRSAWTYSAINVGDRRVKYTGFEIGGGELHEDEKLSYPYRGDSFTCGAAVHAGVVSPFTGGCGRVVMTGAQEAFESRKGRYRTGMSVGFDSFFPSSFEFRKLLNGYSSRCYDPRIPVLVANIVLGLPVFYLSEGLYGYWILTIAGYVTLVFFLDPPIIVDPYDNEGFSPLLSLAFQRFLPLAFVLYVLWKCSVRRTLTNGSPLAKVVCWFPTFWLGVMNNVTFDRLPVDRLTITDLKEQAGAFLAVGSIIATIVSCAVVQAYSLWKSGRFRKYLCIYLSFIAALVALSQLPGLSLRIHHYILGMLLVPGCATRGTSAYLFQGILVGLVLSGVSRWDFASIVETRVALLRGEAGSSWDPPMLEYSQNNPNFISWNFANATEAQDDDLNAFSLLINDVERYVGTNKTVDLAALIQQDAKLAKWADKSISSKGFAKLYLRVARTSEDPSLELYGDYTNAAVLEWPQGRYQEPEPGVS